MVKPFSRVLLALSALILVIGGIIHGLAFPKASSALDATDLLPFYANSFRALWLIDSATLVILSIIFITISARPSLFSRWMIIGLALIPAATAALIYTFVGSFFPAHMLAAASLAAIIAVLGYST
jgi:hypothetical protein